jgi:hypothetical protein
LCNKAVKMNEACCEFVTPSVVNAPAIGWSLHL